MKVTASEVFKGKKANYESSIPRAFSAYRLGNFLFTILHFQCYNHYLTYIRNISF